MHDDDVFWALVRRMPSLRTRLWGRQTCLRFRDPFFTATVLTDIAIALGGPMPWYRPDTQQVEGDH